jgi:hypothetical protein
MDYQSNSTVDQSRQVNLLRLDNISKKQIKSNMKIIKYEKESNINREMSNHKISLLYKST